jgi:putative nucleotidyltransferase with HDIG domain
MVRLKSSLSKRWGHLSIAVKLRLAFLMMLFVILLTASSSYIMLDTVRRKTESAILTSVKIQQIVLQMDGELEKARRQQRDFFLRYPQIGFSEARELYVVPALKQIQKAVDLSKQLKTLLADSRLDGELKKGNIDLDLYLSVSERYVETFSQSVELVTKLANEQDGLQQQLLRRSRLAQEALVLTDREDWIDLYHQIQMSEKDYLITRRRSVMQLVLNLSTMLQQSIRSSVGLPAEQKDELILHLENHKAVGQQVVDLDASIRSKLNDFDLQAQSVDPISEALVEMAGKEVAYAREEIARTTQFANTVLLITGLVGVALATLIADFININVTRNVLKLTHAARELEAGNLQTEVLIGSEDEFGNLAHAFNSMTGRLQGLFTSLQASEARYRSLFEDSPTSLLEEDFSEIKRAVDVQRAAGVSDWQAYFNDHQDEVLRFAGMSRLLDVNRATLTMLKCENKEILLSDLSPFLDENTWRALGEIFVTLIEGQLQSQAETFLRTQEGNTLFVTMHLTVIPGYENSWAKVLISISDITEREHREQEMVSIAAVSTAMRTAKGRAEMLPVIVDQLTRLLNASGVALAIRDPDTGEIRVEQARGDLNILLADIPLEMAFLMNDGLTSGSQQDGSIMALNQQDLPRSVIYLPLMAQGSTIGVLWLSRPAALAPAEMRILTAIADIAANAIHRASLFEATRQSAEALAKAYEATIEGWSMALDLRDKETEGHTQRVTALTLQLARAMGVEEPDLIHIRRGALLHDIGKMGVPDEILRKPGPLNDNEWRIMRQHPELALKLLSPIAYLHQALDIPYSHHEKWDGSGYPRGLQGVQIPLAARIFSIVDVWDALLSDRSYRQAWSRLRVIEYLREQAGHHFDPQVVEQFIRMQELDLQEDAFTTLSSSSDINAL